MQINRLCNLQFARLPCALKREAPVTAAFTTQQRLLPLTLLSSSQMQNTVHLVQTHKKIDWGIHNGDENGGKPLWLDLVSLFLPFLGRVWCQFIQTMWCGGPRLRELRRVRSASLWRKH